jgi:hypothetical protein
MSSGRYWQTSYGSHPGCIVFLLDQSYSMNDGLAGSPRPKIDALAAGINRFVSDLICHCELGEYKPRNWFDVGVIGYTTDRSIPPNAIIGPVLRGRQGSLTGRDLVSVPDLFDDPLVIDDREMMVDDGEGGLVKTLVKFPIWYRKPAPETMGGTPTCAAFDYVRNVVTPWCDSHPGSFPPMVIHLTDGEASDGDPEPHAEALRAVGTDDGRLLLFNCYLPESQATPVVFPASEETLSDERVKVLFRMSSEVPETMRKRAGYRGISCATGARGLMCNAEYAQILMLIQMGTRD